MSVITLTYADLAIAAMLVMINGALSLALELRVERQLAIAAVRMCVQLLLIGLILTQLFALTSPWWTGAYALLMMLAAGREIVARQHRRLRGIRAYGLGTTTMMVAATIVTLLALTVQIRPTPWYDPRYAIPLLGMILGNAMTGISLGLDTLTTSVVRERVPIESALALGATRREALQPTVRQAVRSGLMPTINAMAATGLVALPGMMTGQILAGVPPVEAVKYQILIMFLIAGASGLGVLLAVFGGMRLITDERERLRLDQLAAPRTG